eukprot:gb/GECG01006011.1/.p1 GENE.gb/GECG01006011.1/~~gb/GECG01006011.1/.p1  ORF type:complete len:145 (+),score=3.27 gb/GECG01006011.1/:1-435(+)
MSTLLIEYPLGVMNLREGLMLIGFRCLHSYSVFLLSRLVGDLQNGPNIRLWVSDFTTSSSSAAWAAPSSRIRFDPRIFEAGAPHGRIPLLVKRMWSTPRPVGYLSHMCVCHSGWFRGGSLLILPQRRGIDHPGAGGRENTRKTT